MKSNYIDLFAVALFNKAKKKGISKITEINNEFKAFIEIMKEEKKIALIIQHPSIPMQVKSKIIGYAVEEKLLVDFLIILIRIKMIEDIDEIYTMFSHLVKKENNVADVEVILPYDPENKIKDKLIKSIEKYTGKKIDLKVIINPDIIGGVYIKIGALVIDNTITKELKELQARLINSESR